MAPELSNPSPQVISTRERLSIERINQGDEKAFEELVRAYAARLIRFAIHITRSNEVAKDLVQEVFCHVWENRSRWKPEHTVLSYLYAATRNQAIGYLRHKRFETPWNDDVELIAEEVPSADEQVHATDFSKAVEEAIEDLPDRCRIIFRLHREDGLTYEEIGCALQISQKTVKAQISRAMKILRIKLSHFLVLLPFLNLPD
ncbi:MAG: RNA polymerase sigma-70 factor [Bacteroidota bacterium]